MRLKIRLIVVSFITIVLALISLKLASGWLLGSLTTTLLKLKRDKFYSEILSQTELSKKHFNKHTIFVFLIVSLTLLIPFRWPNIFNPYTTFAAFMFDRLWIYLSLYFIKEDDSHVAK